MGISLYAMSCSNLTQISYLYPTFSITHRPTIISLSFSHPRRRRRTNRRNPNRNDSSQTSPSDSVRLHFVLDVDQLENKAPISVLQRTLSFCESKLDRFISEGTEAYRDLQTLVTVEPRSNRVVVSCSDSTVRFVGGVVLWSCVVVVVVRVLWRVGSGLRRGNGVGKVEVVRRRDRSLGGREVVVAVRAERERADLESLVRDSKALTNNLKPRKERKLPSWWPVTLPRPVVEFNGQEYQREANRLIQGRK